jgi:hypothetical protein
MAADTGSCAAKTVNTPGSFYIDIKFFRGDPIFIPVWVRRSRLYKIR